METLETNPIPRGRLTARVPEPVLQHIEQAALLRGLSVNSFIVAAVAQEANKVLESERLIQLSRGDADRFFAALENPPKPNAALRKALKANKELIGELQARISVTTLPNTSVRR